MNEREMKRHYDELLARRDPEDRTDCPSPEALRALVEQDGPEADRLARLDHVMGCQSCRREFELLRATAAGTAAASAHRQPRTWGLRPGLAAAATVALLVASTLIWQMNDDGNAPLMRGPDETVRVVGPEGAVADAPAALVWRAHPGAVRYRVELVDAAGRVVASGEPRDTTLTLPESAGLASGREYIWWVEAVRLDGTRVRSEPARFTLRR